jgi:hypothetical protein
MAAGLVVVGVSTEAASSAGSVADLVVGLAIGTPRTDGENGT